MCASPRRKEPNFKWFWLEMDLYQSIGVIYLELNFKSGSLYINKKEIPFCKDVLRALLWEGKLFMCIFIIPLAI